MLPIGQASLVVQRLKRLPASGRPGFDPWVEKIPWRGKWQPTPVFLPGESHGRRSLVGYSPWGRKELDMTERFHFTSLHFPIGHGILWKHEFLTTVLPGKSPQFKSLIFPIASEKLKLKLRKHISLY